MIRHLMRTAAVLGTLALFGIGGFAPKAHAQYVNPAMCRQFSHTSHMCITNNSPYAIVGVTAGPSAGWAPTQWLAVPGGVVPPGATVVVTFPTWTGGCNQYVFVHTSNPMHPTHSIFANVCSVYRLTIGSW